MVLYGESRQFLLLSARKGKVIHYFRCRALPTSFISTNDGMHYSKRLLISMAEEGWIKKWENFFLLIFHRKIFRQFLVRSERSEEQLDHNAMTCPVQGFLDSMMMMGLLHNECNSLFFRSHRSFFALLNFHFSMPFRVLWDQGFIVPCLFRESERAYESRRFITPKVLLRLANSH